MRWQVDNLGDDRVGSDQIDPNTIRRNDAEGKLRLQADGNLWGSSLGMAMHAPILDLDFPHSYVPSKTEGHGHLYIHKPVDAKMLAELLNLLHRMGLMGMGNVHQFEVRGQLFAACTTPEAVTAGMTPIIID